MNVAVGRLHLTVSMQPSQTAEKSVQLPEDELERSFRRQQRSQEIDAERERWMLQYRGHHSRL